MAGTIVADTIQDGAGNSTAMDNAIYGSAKAWVNFNGTSGSVAVRASYNVSSITRSSAGIYVATFTNAFADANYAALYTSARNNGGNAMSISSLNAFTSPTQTTTTVTVSSQDQAANYNDVIVGCIVCFR